MAAEEMVTAQEMMENASYVEKKAIKNLNVLKLEDKEEAVASTDLMVEVIEEVIEEETNMEVKEDAHVLEVTVKIDIEIEEAAQVTLTAEEVDLAVEFFI
mmetsp:Transcript_122313/g.182783  ORF Transcript_122313/g.182783 Transcript_122313/m.182783 type:complete len:100 (+) Transcript_122313:652-951(+)